MTYQTPSDDPDRRASLTARVEAVVCDAFIAAVPLDLVAKIRGISRGELDDVLGADRAPCVEIIAEMMQTVALVAARRPRHDRKRRER
jgi:hypothetical protein